jgi:hypothetical protein
MKKKTAILIEPCQASQLSGQAQATLGFACCGVVHEVIWPIDISHGFFFPFMVQKTIQRILFRYCCLNAHLDSVDPINSQRSVFYSLVNN